MGMLEILGKNAHNPEKMEECMDKIQVSADHLLALVNDVLDMNKLETNQIQEENEPFDLEVLMREVAVLMNPLLEQNQITHRVHRKNIQHNSTERKPVTAAPDHAEPVQQCGQIQQTAGIRGYRRGRIIL